MTKKNTRRSAKITSESARWNVSLIDRYMLQLDSTGLGGHLLSHLGLNGFTNHAPCPFHKRKFVR